MKRKTPYWIGTALLCVVALLATATVTYRSCTLPLSQTSEVCRHFAHSPEVKADYIKDMRINDSMTVDVTLLQARDSLAYTRMLAELGQSEELIRDLMSIEGDEDLRFTGEYKKGVPLQPMDSVRTNNDVVVHFTKQRRLVFFHPETEEQLISILYMNYNNEINIQ